MKRGILLKRIQAQGCIFVKHGKKHDVYRNPRTGISERIPRHPVKPYPESLSGTCLRELTDEAGEFDGWIIVELYPLNLLPRRSAAGIFYCNSCFYATWFLADYWEEITTEKTDYTDFLACSLFIRVIRLHSCYSWFFSHSWTPVSWTPVSTVVSLSFV